MSFSDYNTLQYHPTFKIVANAAINTVASGIWRVGTMDGKRSGYLLEFFNQYLKGRQSQHLNDCNRIAVDTILKCGK